MYLMQNDRSFVRTLFYLLGPGFVILVVCIFVVVYGLILFAELLASWTQLLLLFVERIICKMKC